jgi:hypothetical protein
MTFTEDYDPGFVNSPGFGQSATNPLAPVFYKSLGVVENLCVYDSIYAANSVNAHVSFSIGKSFLSQKRFFVAVPTTFLEPVTCERDLRVEAITNTDRLIVDGKEYRDRVIVGRNGTFHALVRV